MIYTTRDFHGAANGKVITAWDKSMPGHIPAQVYCTTVLPGKSKGPHMHKNRAGRFFCAVGEVVVTTRQDGVYETTVLNGNRDCLDIPAGVYANIENKGQIEAVVISMPSGVYDPDDEYTLLTWEPKCLAA